MHFFIHKAEFAISQDVFYDNRPPTISHVVPEKASIRTITLKTSIKEHKEEQLFPAKNLMTSP